MSHSHDRRAGLVCAAALGIVSCVRAAGALESIALDTPRLEGNGWQAEGFSLRVHAGAAPASADLSINQVTLPGPITHVRAVSMHCTELRVAGSTYTCPDASADFELAQRGRVELRGRFGYDAATR